MKSVFKSVIQVHDMEEYPCTMKLSGAVTMQAKVNYAHTHTHGCGQITLLVTCACTWCDVLTPHPRPVSRFASYTIYTLNMNSEPI